MGMMCNAQELDEQVKRLKADMVETVNHLSKENVESCSELLQAQLSIVKGLYQVERLKEKLGFDASQVTDNPPQLASDEVNVEDAPCLGQSPHEPEVEDSNDFDRARYRVDRRLKGAFIEEIEGFIPESILRQLGIEHGDYVYATPIPAVKAGQNRFRYELAEKSEAMDAPGRIEFKGCPVKRDGELLVLNRSLVTGKSIKFNDYPFSIVIHDRDIVQFELAEGDVVDVAFYENNPTAASVIWKHELADLTIEEKPEPKKASPRKEVAPVVEEIEPVFAGQTICLIGDKPNESLYKAMVEERGGTLLHVEPKWNVRRIQTQVKNADVVVGLYDLSKHTGLEKAKAYCKQYGVPYKMIPGKGKSTVLQTAMELLQETS